MDDLISLDWSSSSSSTSKQPPLTAQPKPSSASFDLFAQPKPLSNGANYHSSTPPLKSATPTLPPQPPSSARLQLQASGSRPARSGNASPNPVSPPSHDAFSSLLSINGSSSSENKNLSLAERQAQAAEEKRRQADHERAQFAAHSSFWDNLGSSKPSPEPGSANAFGAVLQPSSAPISRPTSAIPHVSVEPSWDDDDGLLGAGPSSIKQTSSSSSSRQPTPQPPDDPFDFDALEARTGQLRVEDKLKGSSGMRTPVSDFDFGEKQDAESDEDVLGDLGRPAKPLSEAVERSPSPPKRNRRERPTRSDSPPPHVIGRIVEMGFSPTQARQALAKTSDGMDVEAAIESLLAEQGSSHGEDEARRQEEAEAERRRRRRAGPSRDSVRARTKEEIGRASSQQEFGDQADKLLAQATEIGQSVFSKATSLWNTGREKAMKAYEEQRKAMDTERPREPRKDGRPRWMVERDEQEGQSSRAGEEVAQGFKDDDSTDDDRPKRQPKPNGKPTRLHQDRSKAVEPSRVADDHLFDSELQARPSGSRSKPQTRPKVQEKQAAPPPRPATPLIKRKLVDASASQVDMAASHKAAGNEHFKLGRFPEAEASYTRAILALPDGHLQLIPLYNNRAATRLKAGDSGAAMADSTVVIDLIGVTYHPAKEEPLPHDLANEVKLSDALVKAMIKRAQAAEMAEKWALAAEDWEKVLGLDAAILGNTSEATRKLAAEGGRRSRKMLAGPVSPKTAGPASSRTAPKPTVRSKPADLSKSDAVAELRKAAAANEAEDAQRLAVKDQVDARVQAWKSGKEENLRALIASLDTVLWDEILAGGLKVGMHELIQDKQVKIKYMKVVARLHPDKLNVSNTSVEQRMLANAVFGILSDAWQSFNK